MLRFRAFLMTALLFLTFSTLACADNTPVTITAVDAGPAAMATTPPTKQPTPKATLAGEMVSEASTAGEPPGQRFEDFDPGNFDGSTNIDNEWLPLKPGTKWVFAGFTKEAGLTIPHRLVFIVTDLTKEIEGVRTAVAWVEDYSDEQLVEAELAFYAQDNDGNVWFFGEYPEVYENGEFVEAPAWIAGFKGARPGISMKAEPQAGMPSYSQGWGPAVNWTDYAQVDQIGQETCVPVDCYQNVLVIAESSLEEVNIFQIKYYAPGVGNVRVGWRGDDATHEELELVEFGQLSPNELAEAREAALALEARAYEISKEVYDQTPPSEHITVSASPELEVFDSNNFDNSANVDNEWLPLQPGTQWVFEGVTVEDGESIPHRIVFTVTDLTKGINGVQTAVAWIEDFSDDELVEVELAFYAQDNDGNVWYLGEYPEEYEDGEFVAAQTWIAGVEGARAGIKMKAEPQVGTASYFQGWGPAVGWTDYAQVDQVGQETCVPVDCYQDVIVIAESSLEEVNAYQLKYYARGVGNVRVGWRGEDAGQEELELAEFGQLSPETLAEIRDKALALEERAYEISRDVYGHTPPAELTSGE
jgi:hypothetical protein